MDSRLPLSDVCASSGLIVSNMDSLESDGSVRPVPLAHRVQARVLKLLYWLLNALLAVVERCFWPQRRPVKAKRVCIYRIGNVGDTICAVPAMMAIRQAYPQAALTLLTSPGSRTLPGAAHLLEGAHWLDEIRVYYAEDIQSPRGWWNLLRECRQRAFDVWIELPNDPSPMRVIFRNMLFTRLAGARWGYGWRLNTIFWALPAQSEVIDFPSETNRLLAVVRQAGIATDTVSFPLPLGSHHVHAVDRLLDRHCLQGAPLFAMAPGGKRPANRWPSERFAELGRRLVQGGFRVVLLGGESDAGLCREIAESIGGGADNLAGQTTLLESCELLKRCSLAICNDSGVQHLAAAVGTPCVSLFSCRDVPGKWSPYGEENIILRKWVPCHTCYLDICPYDNHCLKLIQVTEVVECVERKQREGKLVVPVAGKPVGTKPGLEPQADGTLAGAYPGERCE